MDWTNLNLIRMFKETGRLPSAVLALTPSEFRYLFIRVVREKSEDDKMLITSRGHIRLNKPRALAGMLPKIVDALRSRMEGK